MSDTCDLCGRVMKEGTTRHHLVPRAVHRKAQFKKRFSKDQMRTTVDFCRDCHRAVHDLLPDEKELARDYYTIELLREHPAIATFLEWVRKQK
jgi:5-methylcytosine-specific restriction endonuclease McrA